MYKIVKYYIVAASCATVLVTSGCGSDSDNANTPTPPTPTTAAGQFKDSNTMGLSFISGTTTGVTGTDGAFTYETGKTVTFSVGAVTLGSTSGKSIVTPIDLIANGNSTNVEVQNIVRFLMMLDQDGLPSNGISISSAVQTAAVNWPTVDFSSTDLPAELNQIVADAISLDGGQHQLPDNNAAQNHLEATLRCAYAGGYKGTVSGDSTGNFVIMTDPLTGTLRGSAYSSEDGVRILNGTTPISYDQQRIFITGISNTDASFSGQFNENNGLAGTWSGNGSGSFTGVRFGGASDAVYRFVALVAEDAMGVDDTMAVAVIDIDSSNNITGLAYAPEDSEVVTLNMTLTGTQLTGSVVGSATTYTGTLNTATGDFFGTWSNPQENITGNFNGSGCRLN